MTLQQDNSLPHVILCDIDGTIALMNGRSPYDWSKVGEDLRNEPVCKIVQSLIDAGQRIIFVSGRDEVCRNITEKWLMDNFDLSKGIPSIVYGNDTYFKLFMRPQNDNRKDVEIKREIFENEIQGKYYVDFVLDDRKQVVKLWRELGLTCLQVAEGDF